MVTSDCKVAEAGTCCPPECAAAALTAALQRFYNARDLFLGDEKTAVGDVLSLWSAVAASVCAGALEILQQVVGRGLYAGGAQTGTHWLFVDRALLGTWSAEQTRSALAVLRAIQ